MAGARRRTDGGFNAIAGAQVFVKLPRVSIAAPVNHAELASKPFLDFGGFVTTPIKGRRSAGAQYGVRANRQKGLHSWFLAPLIQRKTWKGFLELAFPITPQSTSLRLRWVITVP